MRGFIPHIVAGLVISLAATAGAEAPKDDPGKGPRLGKEHSGTYRIGVVVSAPQGACRGILATLPVFADWPEQKVEIVKEEKSRYVPRIEYRTIGGGVKQMRVRIPSLPAGAEATAMLTLNVRHHEVLPPTEPQALLLPKSTSKVRTYLLPSPYIESTHAKIKSLAEEIAADKAEAWQRAEAIYDWVQKHVQYRNGSLKGALKALEDGSGDCEELTSLFIALCRAKGIPARTVWVPGHCYPEFYLTDVAGRGYWIPCELATNKKVFGQTLIHRPILQRGDNFRVPDERGKPKRYVAEFLTAKSGQPTVKFIREQVKAAKEE